MSPAGPALAEVLARWRREAITGVCRTGRYRLPYFTWGSGPPLVFVHGLADRAVSFAPVMAPLTSSTGDLMTIGLVPIRHSPQNAGTRDPRA